MSKRRTLAIAVVGVVVAAAPQAWAVSSGNYDPSKQGCSPGAEDTYRPTYTESGCYSTALSISDKTHRYVMVGIPQTPDGTAGNAVEICLDLTGSAQCGRFDKSGFTQLPSRKGTPITPPASPADAQLHVYFGADDNLDSGEHDGSHSVSNGPSDGGAAELNVTPGSAVAWLASILNADKGTLLTHPLPLADAGTGACADGLCFSVQTQRRVAYTAGGKNAPTRDAADYDGHTWDPPTCAGPTDTTKDCGGSHDLSWWHRHNQTTYVEPGLQIYEDPDPQGSPIGPYPLPAFYVGTCGLVVGGGSAPAFPASPVTNASGQVLVETGC